MQYSYSSGDCDVSGVVVIVDCRFGSSSSDGSNSCMCNGCYGSVWVIGGMCGVVLC